MAAHQCSRSTSCVTVEENQYFSFILNRNAQLYSITEIFLKPLLHEERWHHLSETHAAINNEKRQSTEVTE